MTLPHRDDITAFIVNAGNGDKDAARQLVVAVYAQLRAAAQQHMANERPGHTLTATALVHEAYAKIAGPREVPWRSRAQFYSAAADAMRQLLVDHARAKLAQKRGGPGEDHARPSTDNALTPGRESILNAQEVADLASHANPEEMMSLDAAISRLESEDPQAASVLRLRFFAGLSIEHTAKVLEVSPATVKRDWQFARAWLYRALASGG